MRFFNRAGVGLLLACAPLTGVGCASLSPKMSSIPLVARQWSTNEQYRTALHAEKKQDYAAARDLYATLQQQLPNEAIYAHRMGVVCTQLHEYTTAEKYFEHARKLEPCNVVLLTDMGYAAIVQKDYARAEALLDAAVRLKPDDPRALNNLAMAVGFQGRFDDSLALFHKIKSESQALVNVAYIHTQRGERKQAIECYRRAVALDPNNKLAADTLAQLLPSSPPATAVAASPPSLKSRADKHETTSNRVGETEEPLVKQVSVAKPFPRVTAARPRDRISEEHELPFFEDGEKFARSIADAYAQTPQAIIPDNDKPVIVPEERFARSSVAKSAVAQVPANRPSKQEVAQPKATSPASDDEELILSEEDLIAVAEVATPTPHAVEPDIVEPTPVEPRAVEPTPVEPRAVEPTPVEPREVVATTWESEVVSLTKPVPPQALIEEPAENSPAALVNEANAPESKQLEADESTSLEWTKEQQAELLAAGPDTTKADLLETADGLKGFCPVAIRDERRLVAALDEFACEHQGQTYRCYSAAALEKFQAQPETYAPIAGGLDIVAVRQGETVFNGSLDFAVWYRHRLHLFSNTENLAAFRAAPRSFGSVPR